MTFYERIKIRVDNTDSTSAKALLSERGWPVRAAGAVLIIESDYSGKETLADVRQVLDDGCINAKVYHSVTAEYDTHDLESAELFSIVLPEVILDQNPVEYTCPLCSTKRSSVSPESLKEAMESTLEDIYLIHGSWIGAKLSLASELIKSSLGGIVVEPVTDSDCLLIPNVWIKDLCICVDETIDWQGFCRRCSAPRFGMWFGPPRFRAEIIRGLDYVGCDFFQRAFVSQRFIDTLSLAGIPLQVDFPVLTSAGLDCVCAVS